MTALDYVLRDAVPTDLPVLCEFATAVFPLACPPGVTAEDIAQHCARLFTVENMQFHLENPGHFLQLAVDSTTDELLGYLLLIEGDGVDPEGFKQLHHYPALGIDKLYIREDLHGQGISQALMEWSVLKAQELNFECLWLATNPRNERAIRFYTKQGFSIIGTRQYLVGTTTHNDIVLERPLSNTD